MKRVIKAHAFVTTPGVNEYDEVLSELDGERGAKTSRSIYSATDSNPDEESALVKISRRSGLPLEALRLDGGAEARRRVAAKEAENLTAVAPATANFLASPENARLAHDDVEALAKIERIAREGFGIRDAGVSTLGIAGEGDKRAAARAKTIGSAFLRGLYAAPEKVNEAMAGTGEIMADFVEWSLRAFPDETGLRKRVAEIPRESRKFWGDRAKEKTGEHEAQTAEYYFSQAGTSVGTSILAAPFGMAGKDVALGAFSLFADGGYGEMRDKGVAMPLAGALALSGKGMEGLTEKLGLDALYKGSAPVVKRALGFLLGDMAGEEINTLYNAVADKVTVSPDMTMGDVLQQVVDTAIVTSIAGPAQGVTMTGAAKASETLFGQFEAQREARRQSDFLLALGDGVKSSKTFQRLPSAVQDLVREIKKDGAVEDVFVPVERFTELFQSEGMDPGKAAEQILSDPSRYFEAVATGGDVAIPLEEFARLADAPFYGELVKDARTSLAGMTAREAEAFESGGDDVLNALLTQAAEEDPAEDTTYQTAYQRIYDDTFGQLIGINQAPAEAEANATLRARGLATLAQRYGYDPEKLMEQFPLTVTRGDLPAALQRQPSFSEQQQAAQLGAMLDAIRSGKGAANPSEMFGPSLGEFLRERGVNDDRGDLKSMDVDKGLRFKKKMLRKDGMSLDKAREAAAEAGYLPADSTVADLLNMVDSELRGNPVYSPGNMNQALADKQGELDELAQWLGMMGVDLDQADNDQILQMMQESISGEEFGQGAVVRVGKMVSGQWGVFDRASGDLLASFGTEAEALDYTPGAEGSKPGADGPAGEIEIFRGEYSGNKGGGYYTPDKEFARQFTQSGQDKEIISAFIDASKVYKSEPLPAATSEAEFDAALSEAKEKGFAAVWFSEGVGEPPSIFVIDKKVLSKKRRAAKLYQGATGPRLIVNHNLTSENLIYADEIGGLAAPSLAVTPEGVGHESYGDITLIGTEELGNPEKEPVLDSDAYSATFPRPEYPKVPSKVALKVANEFRPYAAPYDEHYLVDSIYDNAVDRPNPAKTLGEISRYAGVKAKFLKDVFGVELKPVMIPVPRGHAWTDTNAWREFIEANKAELDRGVRLEEEAAEAARAAVEEFVDAVKGGTADEATKARLKKLYSGERTFGNDGFLRYSIYDRAIEDARNEGKEIVDKGATREAADAALAGHEAEFKTWLEKKILGMYGEPFLKVNGKKAPYTLDNIVDFMTSQKLKASEKTLVFGSGTARAAAAHRFKGLEEMRQAAADNILPKKEVEALREETNKLLEDYRTKVAQHYKGTDYKGNIDYWNAFDDSMKALARWAKGAKNAKNLQAALTKEGFGKVPAAILDLGVEAGTSMLKAPVPYFEAKPQRAVKLSEFAGAVVPDDASPEVLAILKKHGIAVKKYGERFDEGARHEAAAQLRGELQAKGASTLFQSAWHGSPHTFDKFRTSAIGTGEGAAAYGWGIYAAGDKAVAEYYRGKLSSELTYKGRKVDRNAGYNTTAAAAWAVFLADGNKETAKRSGLASAEKIDAIEAGSLKSGGRLYAVELAPKEDEYLLWDRPFSEQSEAVKKGIGQLIEEYAEIFPSEAADFRTSTLDNERGSSFYGLLSLLLGGQQNASRDLLRNGVRGIKYLDGSTRNNTRWQARHPQGGIEDFPNEEQARAYAKRYPEYELIPPKQNFNYVIFSEDDVEIKQMWQAKRGYIKILDTAPGFEIALLKDADASTFIHELGHYYEEILGRLAAQPDAPAQLKADYAAILSWLGAESKEGLTIEQREKFARGFEAYLYEGSAPSQELRGVFQRFKVWLKAVYSSLKSLNVELTDEVRGVFDRLLATDEEIAAAEREQNVKPLFTTAEDAGMSAAVFEAYRQLGERAHEEAKDKLEREKLREAKRAHQTWWKEAHAKMTEEVEAEAKQNPAFEVLHFLRTGKLFDGSPFEGESFKLSGAALLKAYDSGTLKGIRKRLGNVYAKEGGLAPEVVAEMFGFSSVDEMISKMMEAPKLRDFVKAETERRMAEVYGHMTGAEIAEEAINAVHNDDHAKLVREELKAIRRRARDVKPIVDAVKGEGKAELSREKKEREYERRWFEAEKSLALAIEKGAASVEIDRLKAEVARLRVEMGHERAERAYERRWMDAERALVLAIERGALQAEIDDLKASIRADKAQARAARQFDRDTVPPAEAFRESARRHIATLKVSEILPGKYARAEAKASQEAFTLNGKGKYSEAAAAKTRQLLNHYLYREAVAAKAEAEKIALGLRKLATPKAQARLGKAGEDYLEQVNALLEQYEFKRQTGATLAERERLLEWVERMEKLNGFPPPIPPAILEESLQINFRTLSMSHLRDVNDAVKAITFMARMNGKILKAQELKDIHTLAVEAAGSIEANSRGKRPRLPEKALPQDVPGKLVENYFASHRKMSSLARQMDGGEDGGVMWELIIRPMNEAGDREATMRAEAAARLNELFGVYSAVERTKMHRREFIPEINSSMSKWGRIVVALNMGNEGNLQRLGSMFNAFQVDRIVDGLDARDWQFVQDVWDFLNSYWPAIEAKEKRVHGVAPLQVEAIPVRTKFGPLQGGYWPIKYDAEETAKAGAQQEQEILQQMMGGAFTRATTRHGHTEARLEAVNRPLTLSMDVLFQHLNQVIHDLTHHEMLYDVNRLLGTKEIQEAIRDHYGMEAYRVFTDGIRDVAVGDIPAQDTFEKFMNYTRIGISTAGLGWNLVTSMMQPLGFTQSMVRIGPKWVGKGVGRWISSPKRMVETAEWVYSVSSFMENRALTQNREIAEIRNQMTVGVIPHAVRDSFFYFIQQMQKLVDIPTWLGQYEKSMAEHGNEADAIAAADQAVIDSQASGMTKDLARIQRGGPLKKLFTTFYSFFSTTYNLAAESKARTDFKNPSEVGRFLVDMLLLYTVPAVISSLLKEGIQYAIGGGDDDDEELLKRLAGDQLGYIMGGFVGLRELGAIFGGFQGYEGPAGSRFYSEASKLAKEISQGDWDEGLFKRLNSLGGILFHYPATQISRTVQGMKEIKDGRGNLLSLLFGKPRQ